MTQAWQCASSRPFLLSRHSLWDLLQWSYPSRGSKPSLCKRRGWKSNCSCVFWLCDALDLRDCSLFLTKLINISCWRWVDTFCFVFNCHRLSYCALLQILHFLFHNLQLFVNFINLLLSFDQKLLILCLSNFRLFSDRGRYRLFKIKTVLLLLSLLFPKIPCL